jgi:mannose/fructose/N-acetylgalactosamine-specific phosphotransferase system component IID
MYLVAIAWMYVALMMAIAEATHSNGSLLGALITFVLYGVGPLALVLYLIGTPHRRRAQKLKEQQALEPARAQPQQKDTP